jgi:ATP-dependent Lhr-like helicase
VAWRQEHPGPTDDIDGSVEGLVLQLLNERGAMFSEDLAFHAGVLPAQLEQALGTLVARGLITADAFSPLRWLSRPEAEKHKRQKALKRRNLSPVSGLLGRWSSVASHSAPQNETSSGFDGQASLETICHALLKRYGVLFRAVIEREQLLPPWRLILRFLRRMEDRGEVSGGRFVDGFSGEQFALPEAVAVLRRNHETPGTERYAVINATDPLNLGGIITPGSKTPSKPGNRILLENGIPVAHLMGDSIEMLVTRPTEAIRAEAENRLRVVRAMPGLRHRQGR